MRLPNVAIGVPPLGGPPAAPTAIWRHRAGQGSSSSALARSRNAGACSSRSAASASRCSRGAKSRATSSRIDAGTAVAASNGLRRQGRSSSSASSGDAAAQLGQAAGEVVEAVAGQDLEPAVVLVAPEHGGGGREGVEDEVQVLAGQLGNGIGHGHTLLSGGSMLRRIRGVHEGSAISQVPFL
jgi:hypothetical protein